MSTVLEQRIQSAYAARESLNPQTATPHLLGALEEVMEGLEDGTLRAATYNLLEKQWQTQVWIKQAILLYFLTHESSPLQGSFTQFYDKVPLRFRHTTAEDFQNLKLRIVPPASIRRGAYIAKGAIIMPSFINIGASIGSGTMVDSFVTVGSCAQIGAQVHLSMCVGIGGVLEPLQTNPTIIEDHCFIGAGSQIVEGIIIEQGSVLSMGTCIGQSTAIYDRETQETYYGRVPAYSVVVPGTLPREGGRYSVQAAIIVKKVDAQTRQKTGINTILREALTLQ
ncbi:MAG: 2,3,4,5-tetrahydropyridine-2,6-dicarboxylate N-succinyltransferase [Gammaproteobacteria bacterium]|nr:2,3,4,5-tetrahydropyridine-2,6-dicarboxylate N-succinyltransferase [Gammaproteobacteria bacterium]MBP9729304.1 2,3,4,5-tetrahydropyridine-2,6-dicarboxylate N-succinyltransferase [Gammaproteobacteria bacterium]